MTPNTNPDWEEILRSAHNEPLDAAHYTAVRARVLAELERGYNPWRRLAWISGVGALAACLLLALWMQHRPELPPLRSVAAAIPPAPVGRVAPPVARVARSERPPIVRRHHEPLTIKLQTADPNIVIYWIAD